MRPAACHGKHDLLGTAQQRCSLRAHIRKRRCHDATPLDYYMITAYLHETTRGRSSPFVQLMQCTALSARIAVVWHRGILAPRQLTTKVWLSDVQSKTGGV